MLASYKWTYKIVKIGKNYLAAKKFLQTASPFTKFTVSVTISVAQIALN